MQGIQRQQSFDVGDDRRVFSAGANPPPEPNFPVVDRSGALPNIPQGAPLHVQTDLSDPARYRSDTTSTASRYPSVGGFSNTSDAPSSVDPTHRRDYSPSAMPSPLNSRLPGSSAPQSAVEAHSSSMALPPGANNRSQPSSPQATSPGLPPVDDTPRQRAPSNPTKPLPFIRPADIYKRMEEERARERASQDSSRPSMDSLLRPGEDARTPKEKSSSESLPSVQEEPRTGTPASQKKPTLPTVSERRSEYIDPDSLQGPVTQLDAAPQIITPHIDQGNSTSNFASEFQQYTQPKQTATDDGGLQHQPSLGFRSVVHQAFDQRPTSERSGADSAVSKQSSVRSPTESGVSRSNTDSTAGISPIMSGVPSGGAFGVRGNYTQDHSTTPAIAEEPAESIRPLSLTNDEQGRPARKFSPSHSRDHSNDSASFIPGYRRNMNTPPSHGSPAKTPELERSVNVPGPTAGRIATEPASAQPGTTSLTELAACAIVHLLTFMMQEHLAPTPSVDQRYRLSPASVRSFRANGNRTSL